MARLELFVLGSFQVKLAGQPVTGFEADKVREGQIDFLQGRYHY